MRRLLLLVLALVMSFSMLMPETGTAEINDEFVTHLFESRKIKGGAVVISRDGEILYSMAYGYRNASKTEPVTLNTCFRIASVTKMVTALGVARLCREQDISFDTPVGEILKENIVNPAYTDQPITLRQVMTHTSGFQQMNHYHPNWSVMTTNNNYFTPNAMPGKRYIYSNLNGGLLGAVIEALSGQSLNTYMRENIFDPLDVNAAYHPALLADSTDLANRLKKDGSVKRSARAELESIGEYEDFCDPSQHTEYSVGQLYISADGLNKILSMLMANLRDDDTRILPHGTVAEMTAPQNFDGSSVSVDDRYVLGLERLTDLPGGYWYGHQGMMDGLSSDAYFQPDTGLCVTVIANGYEPMTINGVTGIARELMEAAAETAHVRSRGGLLVTVCELRNQPRRR